MSSRVGLVIAGLAAALALLVLVAVMGGAAWMLLGGGAAGVPTALDRGSDGPTRGDAGAGAETLPAAAGEASPAKLPDAGPAVGTGADGPGHLPAPAAPVAAVGAGVVQALVVSARTEQPLAGAVLTLSAATTDGSAGETRYTSEATVADGRITLADVVAGTYHLRVSRPGCSEHAVATFELPAAAGRDLGTVALTPAPAITGTVSRLNGSAAQGATVELVNEVALSIGPDMSMMDVIADLRADEITYATVNADAQGTYTIWWDQTLPGDYAMRAGVNASATAHAGISLAGAGTVERDFSLAQPAVLSGTVTDHEGKPCTGCRLIAVPEPNNQMLMQNRKMMIFKNIGSVAADGAFRFDQLTPGRYMLFAGGGRYTQKMINNVTVPTEEYAIQLERGIALQGRVTDSRTGDPIGGVKIGVGGAGGFEVGRTDDQGYYEFTGIANRGLELFVEAEGYPSVQRRVPGGGDTGTVHFDVKLDAGLVLQGRVRGPGGEPVAGAKVIVMVNGSGFTPGGVPQSQSGADGRFEVRGVSLDPRGMGRVEVQATENGRPVPARTCNLSIIATAPGYVQGTLFEITLAPDQQPPPLEVPMLHAARVSGRVVDSAGNPIPGASVTAVQRKPADQPDGEPTGVDQSAMMMAMMMPDRAVRTGPDGRFVIDDVRPGAETRIRAKHAEFAGAESEPFATQGGKAADAVELTLSGGSRLVLVAVGADGKPAVGQQLQLEPDFKPEDLAAGRVNPMEMLTEQFQPKATGPDGKVTFSGLAKGDYKVKCHGPLVLAKGITAKVDGKGEVEIELTVVKGLTIEGVVRDHLGGIPAEGWVWAEPATPTGETGNQSVGSQQIGANGTFKFSNLAPGMYKISAFSNGGGRADGVAVQAGQTGVTIQFKALAGAGK